MLLNKLQAAKHLGMSVRTLDTLMHNGTGPRFLKLSPRMVRFRQADLDAWIDAQPSFSSISQAARAVS